MNMYKDFPRKSYKKYIGFIYIGSTVENFVGAIQATVNEHLDKEIFVDIDNGEREINLYYLEPESDDDYKFRYNAWQKNKQNKILELKQQLEKLENEN